MLRSSEGYRSFRKWVPQQKVNIELDHKEKVWKYYDWGPKDGETLVCLPGVSGTAESFFRIFLSLCPKGYRVISAQPAPYWTYSSWLDGFDRFLDCLNLQKAHIFGTSLGGYQAQCYAQYRPNRVSSLILQNSFCDTHYFQESAPCAPMFTVMPAFVLQRYLLSNFPSHLLESEIANSVDFMVQELEDISQPELASRLILNCVPGPLKKDATKLSSHQITIIDTLDEVAIPEQLREEVYKFYPNSKVAYMKSGGNFPFLSRSDEFNLHLIVHLRANASRPNETRTTLETHEDSNTTDKTEETTEAKHETNTQIGLQSKTTDFEL